MKKIATVLLFFVLMFSCAKTNVNAQSGNDAQRIIGTWLAVDRDADEVGRIVFNANGTVSGELTGRYFVSGSNLFIRTSDSIATLSYYLSSDGRLLVLSGSGISYSPWWLEKQ